MRKKKPATDFLAQPACGNCLCWKRLDDSEQDPAEDVRGICRRYPDTVTGRNEKGEVIQDRPIQEAREWCFEHKPRIH